MIISKVVKLLNIGIALLPMLLQAQQSEVAVSFSEGAIKIDEKFSIKVVIRAKEYEVSAFPDIEGFSKGGRSVAHTAFKEGGKRGLEHTITQSYLPKAVGVYKLSPFALVVNNKNIELDGEVIRVIGDKDNPDQSYSEGSEDVSGIIEIKEDAIVALTVSKESVFVGEGFRVVVAFYVSDLNTAGWDFPKNLNAQVEQIAQTIKPSNCLENRLEITNVSAQSTVIKGKKYTQYKIFEAIYFPLNEKEINFRPIELTMFRADDKRENKRLFRSNPRKLIVKALSEHPLKEKVAVGSFYSTEWLSKSLVETGNSFTYQFRIIGEGNFTTVNLVVPQNDERFDFYPPQITSNFREGKLNGDKEFKFTIFPKDSGTIALGDYIQWIYFDIKKQTYDTLKAKATIKVEGNKIKSTQKDVNDIYAGLEDVDTSVAPISFRTIIKNITNVLAVIVIVSLLYMLKRERQ